jgi:hypothetical protein
VCGLVQTNKKDKDLAQSLVPEPRLLLLLLLVVMLSQNTQMRCPTVHLAHFSGAVVEENADHCCIVSVWGDGCHPAPNESMVQDSLDAKRDQCPRLEPLLVMRCLCSRNMICSIDNHVLCC